MEKGYLYFMDESWHWYSEWYVSVSENNNGWKCWVFNKMWIKDKNDFWKVADIMKVKIAGGDFPKRWLNLKNPVISLFMWHRMFHVKHFVPLLFWTQDNVSRETYDPIYCADIRETYKYYCETSEN